MRITLLVLTIAASIAAMAQKPKDSQLREMRGVWVATVANIDWPSKPGLDEFALKQETDAILDNAADIGFNTIFLQVRPSSDAIYFSAIEPMTSYVIGENYAPPLAFDPLAYWIEGAHRRGLELHAWINPFRVKPKDNFTCGANHISYLHPEWTIKYGGKTFLDPGLPQARQYVMDVVMDIANRYDIDGIHFDDYLYPYPVNGERFNDDNSFNNYNPKHLNKADWRRSNVTDVIKTVSDSIKAVKPWLQFGISPFGVWRNKRTDPMGSDTKAGISNYDDLYADVLNWIDNQLVDYITPQIYWESGNKWADFDELERWWAGHSTAHTRIFIGHAIYRINMGKNSSDSWNTRTEMPNQLLKVRNDNRTDGSVLFSFKHFSRNLLGLKEYLKNNLYSNKALQCTVAEKNNSYIEIKHLERDGNTIKWNAVGDTSHIRFFMVFRTLRDEAERIGDNESIFCITDQPYIRLTGNSGHRQRYVYRIAAVDKYRNIHELSRRITIRQ